MIKSYIICIDDEKIILDSLQYELRFAFEEEHIIEVSENAQDALHLLEELLQDGNHVPVVICDYIMPEMKGDELLARIHERSPLTRKIMLTGQSNVEGITYVINYADLYRFIAKPWHSQDLVLTVREGIKSYYQQQSIISQNQQLKEVNKILEEKVEERTQELQNALDILNVQKKSLEHRNTNIQSSIRYAKRIQEALLPSQETLTQYLREFFLIYRPRDIVSGDFYWFYHTGQEKNPAKSRLRNTQFRLPQDGKLIFVLADCTGHGVPGALMSMIGANLLNDIVIQKGVTEPDEILSRLNQQVYHLLKQEHTQNMDGMAMAVCVQDLRTNLTSFALASQRLIYFKQGELREMKGDRMPIGGCHFPKCRDYSSFHVSVENTSMFYLFSDGYADQIGGPRQRKFGLKQLRDTLSEIHSLPLAIQKQRLSIILDLWQGQKRQVDDISMMGIRLQRT